MKEFRQGEYAVHLVYFWLRSADLAVPRVAKRVQAGGHGIPEATIRRRYHRSLENCFRLYRPVVSEWRLYDNSDEGVPLLVASGEDTGRETVLIEENWRQIREEAGA